MQPLAAAPNVAMKISGLGMADHGWTIERIRSWILAAIDVFSPSRCMFGSNWPVDRLYSSYGDVLDAYWEIIGDFTAAEQEALFNGTANRVFGI